MPPPDRARLTPVKPKSDPFKKLADLLWTAVAATDELRNVALDLLDANRKRNQAADGLLDIWVKFRAEAVAVEKIRSIHLGDLDAKTLSEDEKNALRPSLVYLHPDGTPRLDKINKREWEIEAGLILVARIRAHVTELNQRLRTLRDPQQRFVWESIMDLGTYYLEASYMRWADGDARLAFLESFYKDDATLATYALLRWARSMYLDDSIKNLAAPHAGS
jgi:hypothetical protein